MVIYKDKRFITNSEHPDDDFMGNADFVIPDNSELAQKILALCPNFELVFDGDGNIVDAAETDPQPEQKPPEPPTNAELAAAIAELAEVICGG